MLLNTVNVIQCKFGWKWMKKKCFFDCDKILQFLMIGYMMYRQLVYKLLIWFIISHCREINLYMIINKMLSINIMNYTQLPSANHMTARIHMTASKPTNLVQIFSRKKCVISHWLCMDCKSFFLQCLLPLQTATISGYGVIQSFVVVLITSWIFREHYIVTPKTINLKTSSLDQYHLWCNSYGADTLFGTLGTNYGIPKLPCQIPR